jgi:hypothetical protein
MIEISKEEIEVAKRKTHKLNQFERPVMVDDYIVMTALILRLERAEARIAELTDNPEFDATDGAHPAWWRGHDDGARKARARIAELLNTPEIKESGNG